MARDLVCFSHLRWDFVYQRPNHLMARAAADRRVFFIEEPLHDESIPRLTAIRRAGVTVITPHLPRTIESDVEATHAALGALVDELFAAERIRRPVLWYYTPMALPWTRHLESSAVVYDSMDYLAGFRGAARELLTLEDELLRAADLVFCGGRSLHERIRLQHPSSHCFPSSVDVAHFAQARTAPEPDDQAGIPRPRIGYAGVIDERVDVELIDGLAANRPDWQVVLVGPVAKISDDDLPRRPNVHLLGLRPYADLPPYLGGWDVGWMPFARNEATRYISPTKTPEYLAAGLPVVSTSIADVIDPYGRNGMAAIADTVEESTAAIERMLAGERPEQAAVSRFLASRSWDRTWAAMAELVDALDVVPVSRARPVPARRTAATPQHVLSPAMPTSAAGGSSSTTLSPGRARTDRGA